MAPRLKSNKSPQAQGPSNWFCESCRDYHPTYAALLRHYSAVHKPLRNRRPPNNFSAKGKTHPVGEGKAAQVKKPIFKCTQCPNNFTTEEGLTNHKQVHRELFKCHECNEEVQRCKYYGHLSAHTAAASASTLESRVLPTLLKGYKLPTRRYIYLDASDPRSGGADELFWCKTCRPIHTFYSKEGFENHKMMESHLTSLSAMA